MVDVFNLETAYRYGDSLPTLLKCRYREFVLRHKYDVPVYNGMEYDQYDTPAAVYLTWKDSNSILRAGIRLSPTCRPYMIKDLWPHTVQEIDLPQTPHVWEITRLFVDKEINAALRYQAHAEILCAMLEFGLYYGINQYIAVAPPNLWDYTFRRFNWPAETVGPSVDIGYSEKIQTCVMAITSEILEAVRSITGISAEVLSRAIMAQDSAKLVDPALLMGGNFEPGSAGSPLSFRSELSAAANFG